MAALTQGSVRKETTYRTRRIPIATAHARGRISGATSALGSRRSAGLRAQDTMTNVQKTSGVNHLPIGDQSPASKCDATAPEKWKKAPAYAHSLSRGNPGAMITAAAPSCHTPKM